MQKIVSLTVVPTLILSLFCSCKSSPEFNEELAAKKIAAAPNGNIALGKKYKAFQAPVTIWHRYIKNRGEKLPDYSKILTDGKTEPNKMFWTSEKCANFMKTTSADILIDLEDVYPIEEITTRHGARPAVGIFMPRKEEYFVSVNGKDFVKAGEFLNSKDPLFIEAPYDKKAIKKFTDGIEKFSSGKIKTYGRYVLVRTYGFPNNASKIHLHFPGYVSYDEIVVKGGKFKIKDAITDQSETITLENANPAPLTYKIERSDWLKKIKENPFMIGLMPQSFIGDDEYHMTVDGVYALAFDFCNMASGKVSDIEFKCILPQNLELLDWNNNLKTVEKKNSEIDGEKYTEIIQKLADNSTSAFNIPFYIVAPTGKEAQKDYGQFYFSYKYRIDKKTYSVKPQKIKIVLDKKINVAAPKNFRTGFWLPYYMRTFKNPEKTCKRLFSFYKSAGFNWANGGQKSKEIYKALKSLNLHASLEGGLAPNALQVVKFDKKLRSKIPKEDFFVFYPEKKNPPYGVCPTKLIAGKFDKQLIARAKEILKTTDDAYENWEPYMFEKHGCACKDCKNAFKNFAKLSEKELNDMWPQCVSDWSNEKANAFSTWQYGQIVKKYQETIRKAGKELNLKHKPDFVPSLEPRYMNPETQHYKVQSPKDYIKYLNKLIFWFYHNTVNYLGIDEHLLVGNNLPIIKHFNNAKKLRREYGRKDSNGQELPKLYYLPAEYWTENYVMPKDFYFISVLTFIEGLDGYGAWQRGFKQDARYIEQNAKANRFISFYEKTLEKAKADEAPQVKTLTPIPEIFGRTPKVIYARSFNSIGKQYVALGNDYYLPIFVELKFKNLPKGNYALINKLDKKAYAKNSTDHLSSKELKKGITLRLEPKSWEILELASPDEAGNCKIISQNAILDKFEEEKPGLDKISKKLSVKIK